MWERFTKDKKPAENPQKTENPAKPEKSQEELRAALKQKLNSLKPVLDEGMKEYEQALKEGLFEPAEGEPESAGEARKEALQKKLTAIVDRAEKLKIRLDSKEALPQFQEEISAEYTHPDGKKETISLNLEEQLQDFLSFYQKTRLDLPPDFEGSIREIWDRNQTAIEQVIEQNGFDGMLIIPGNIPLPELKDKMSMESGYWESDNFKQGGSFAAAISQNTDKSRIILVHKAQNLQDRPELNQTLNIKGEDVKLDQALTLEDYLVFQRKYFEETLLASGGKAGKHLDEVGWTWLATKSGARLVDSDWNPGNRRLGVSAVDLGARDGALGARPTRCFF